MNGRGKKLSKPKIQNKINNNRNPFILKKKKIQIKDRIIRDVRTVFEQQGEDYYKYKRVSNFRKNNYIEHENNDDKNRNVSLGKNILTKLNLTWRIIGNKWSSELWCMENSFNNCNSVYFFKRCPRRACNALDAWQTFWVTSFKEI